VLVASTMAAFCIAPGTHACCWMCLSQPAATAQEESAFCCDTCRKRTTPASVRYYMGRRRYSATAMILLSAVRNEIAGSTLAAVRASLGVSRQTLERWIRWWREDFVQTPLWQAQQGRFMPPLFRDALPFSLLDRFTGNDARIRLIHLLRFLLPLSGPGMFTSSEAR
jgi:hypothetical protein